MRFVVFPGLLKMVMTSVLPACWFIQSKAGSVHPHTGHLSRPVSEVKVQEGGEDEDVDDQTVSAFEDNHLPCRLPLLGRLQTQR